MDDEPDPVISFASSIEHALAELRAEVAASSATLPMARARPAAPRAPAAGPVVDATPTGEQIPVPKSEPVAEVEPHRRARRHRVRTAAIVALGVSVVVTVLLVTVGPLVLPYETYFVRSGSMEPAIPTGALVVLRPVVGARLDVDDIITFERPGDAEVLVTHRIVAVELADGERRFVTKGDANASVDPWLVPATDNMLEYAFAVPLLGYGFGLLGSTPARIALVAGPVLVLAGSTLVGRRRNASTR